MQNKEYHLRQQLKLLQRTILLLQHKAWLMGEAQSVEQNQN